MLLTGPSSLDDLLADPSKNLYSCTCVVCVRKMVDSAWQWAAKHNKLRINEVHGEEEACLILSESFQLLDEIGQEINMQGALEMEETLLNHAC